MFQSIFEDIKAMIKHGSMLTKLILINIFSFVIIGVFFKYLIPSVFDVLLPYLALSSDIVWNLKHPWVFITHMFMHDGLYHIFWNLLLYYWFGTIVGDLIGDKKILPLYIYGGLTGAVFYLFSYYFILPQNLIGGMALGASAAVMATVVAAGVISPDYKVRLILIGPVSIKYIVVVLIVIDLIGTTGNMNTGGHIAHLGGAFFGWFFVSNLKRGMDLSLGFNRLIDKLSGFFISGQNNRGKLKVTHRNKKVSNFEKEIKEKDPGFQKELDRILDKINERGYDQLSDEEKEFLFLASKKDQ